MSSKRLEHERPTEWLQLLAETSGAYEELLSQSGGLAGAAYRLAKARSRAQSGGENPTLRELQAAATSLARELGLLETLPITSLLVSDCEEQGLLVIRPMPTPPSSRRQSEPSLRRAG